MKIGPASLTEGNSEGLFGKERRPGTGGKKEVVPIRCDEGKQKAPIALRVSMGDLPSGKKGLLKGGQCDKDPQPGTQKEGIEGLLNGSVHGGIKNSGEGKPKESNPLL